MRNIVLTGVSGGIGGDVWRVLSAAEDVELRCLTRDPDAVAESVRNHPRTKLLRADLADAHSLHGVCAGANAALLVTSVSPDQVRVQGHFVDALARHAPAAHLVKISGLGTALDSFVDSGRWHAETEAQIRTSGLGYSFLRPFFIMQNFERQLSAMRKSGVLAGGSTKARIATVDRRDVAEVAARLLRDAVGFENRALDLTAREALTYGEMAEVFARALDREVRHVPLSDEQQQAFFDRIGMPPWHQAVMRQFDRAFEEGLASEPTDAIERVLGRAPRSLADFAATSLAG